MAGKALGLHIAPEAPPGVAPEQQAGMAPQKEKQYGSQSPTEKNLSKNLKDNNESALSGCLGEICKWPTQYRVNNRTITLP